MMQADITFEQINGTLGSLLRLWTAIERQAQLEIRRDASGTAKSVHGIAATLNAWETFVLEAADPGSLRAALARQLRAQLQPHLAIRNGLCHGLIGTQADHGEQVAMLAWELNGAQNTVPWDELQANFKWLSKVPYAISMLSQPTDAGLGSRFQGTAEDLKWWMDEFGIDASRVAQG